MRVELKAPETLLRAGLQIDEGTVAVLFQAGRCQGVLDPGYHELGSFCARLFGFDKGREAHAILLDTRGGEVDFVCPDVRLRNQLPVEVRVRLLFRVADPRGFVERVVRENGSFATADLVKVFEEEVRAAVAAVLAPCSLDELFSTPAARAALEAALSTRLQPELGRAGLGLEGLRLAQFGGQAYEGLQSKLGEIDRLNRELEINRRLQDAVREGKIDAYRDAQQAQDAMDRIAAEFRLGAEERRQEFLRVVEVTEHRTRREGLRLELETRRVELTNRLEEQKLRQVSDLLGAMHAIQVRTVQFTEELRQQELRFEAGQQEQVRQARTDLALAKTGIEALSLVRQSKREARERDEVLDLKMESERMQLRGSASLQALLATLGGEPADRVLKLAELELRKGLAPEQALALVVEQRPEIAPAIAAMLRARLSSSTGGAV